MDTITQFMVGEIRGDQLADEILRATGLDVSGRYVYQQTGALLIAGEDVPLHQGAIQVVIDAHVPDPLYSRHDQLEANRREVTLRYAAHALKGKTPGEIYQLIQGRIDSWNSLAAAKADLRDWLPLLAAAVAWMVMEREG